MLTQNLSLAFVRHARYNHVNNATYFSYFEEARLAAWRKKGDGRVAPKGIAPVISNIWCAFHRPIALEDTVTIALRVENVQPERSSMDHRYVVWSESQAAVAAQGGATVVLCDFDHSDGRRAAGLTVGGMERWL